MEQQRELFTTPEKKDKTIYLIDGSAYVFRAYHAIRGLTNSKGLPTNAIFGFCNILGRLLKERQPEYAVMLFDVKGPTFRHEIYEEYKANRPPAPEDLVSQIPWIKKVTKAFGLPIVELSGYEADDLTGTLSRLAQEAGFRVVMVTGDKDFKQLVTDKACIWEPMKDVTTTMESIREEMDVTPAQIIDIMGFTGDTADNIPGVPGIGPKTALTLIHQFGSLEGVYENIDTITKKKQKEKLVENREKAFLSKDLVTIRDDAPVSFDQDAFKLKGRDTEALKELYAELEFKKLLEQLKGPKKKIEKHYHPVLDIKQLKELVKKLKKAEIFALDTETTALNPMLAELVGLSFSVTENEAYYIPCEHEYEGAPEQLSRETVLAELKPVLEDPEMKKVGQNIKYDWIVLSRHGIDLAGVAFDTMLASYLLNPAKRAHNLDQIAMDLFDHKTISFEDVAGKGKKALLFSQVPLDKAVPYACEDADITLCAYNVFHRELKEAGLLELMETIEMPLLPVLMQMEKNGILVDREKLQTLSELFEHELTVIRDEIYNLAGEEFNINSSQQLGKILFEKLELPVQKKTKKKTGYSTDVDVLTSLSSKHQLPAHVLRYRTLTKLKSTYADALTDLINPETGRIHTSFNQTVTVTGRLSSSDPNLQNIPIRTSEGREIRKAFVPRKGHVLMAADYSQIELRILAHCSGDEILIDSFNKGEDIHTRTAAEVFQEIPQLITDDLRRQAKSINFGIIYGMGAFKLSKELEISRKMAQTYIDNYFSRYSGVREFLDSTIAQAHKEKKVETISGRIRNIPEIESTNRTVQQFAERAAINTPIQGSAADLIKLSMINMDREMKKAGMKSLMVLSVHDEIVFEVPEEELEPMKELALKVMENVWDLKVPLKVNIDTGENWAEAH